MKFSHVFGIDVASSKLDVFDAQSGKLIVLKNTYEAVRTLRPSLRSTLVRGRETRAQQSKIFTGIAVRPAHNRTARVHHRCRRSGG